MKKTLKAIAAITAVALIIFSLCCPAFAAGENAQAETAAVQEAEETKAPAEGTTKAKAIAAAVMIAIAAATGAIAMAIAIKSGSDGISRQPEAAGSIRTNTMLGLVFIETAIIYALIVAILIIFVL